MNERAAAADGDRYRAGSPAAPRPFVKKKQTFQKGLIDLPADRQARQRILSYYFIQEPRKQIQIRVGYLGCNLLRQGSEHISPSFALRPTLLPFQ